jgi:acyl-CoA thioester hydrolase
MSRPPLLGRDAYPHWHSLPILWADNDLYGHVNNAVHYRWFDTVVNIWLIDQGLLDLSEGDPICLLVGNGCRYAASLSYPDTVEIGLKLDQLGTTSVTYRLGVFAKGHETAAAEGHFTHVCVTREGWNPRPWPEIWREKFASLS